MVHRTQDCRVDWFEKDTLIVYWRNNLFDRLVAKTGRRIDSDAVIGLPISGSPVSKIGSTNILVIPEMCDSDLAAAYGRRIKKMVLNLN